MGQYSVFALILIASAAIGALAVRLRQPLIAAYMVVGIAAGPAGMGLVSSGGEIELLAQVGVTVLLFVVGLKLDLHLTRHVGPVALVTGVGQILLTIALAYVLCAGLGMSSTESLYISGALTFSSTIIIVKLLSDKREIDSLHGRIAVGVLIVQDIAVVAAMMLLGSAGTASIPAPTIVVSLAFKLAVAAFAIFMLMRYVLPPLLHRLARSQELLLLFAVAWGTALAALSEHFGFSKEVGAFLAGFSLASTSYREAISSRLATLRDFLLLFFFIDLGAKLRFAALGAEVGTSIVLSGFVLIAKPMIVMAIMAYMGYRKRTSFMTALSLAQVSEFSIVFVALGVRLGHVAPSVLSIVTLVGLVTISVSAYMIRYSQSLYSWLGNALRWFERSTPFRELAVERGRREEEPPDIIVFGAGRFGRRLMHQLRTRGRRVLAVDFDPETVRTLRLKGQAVRFGDAEDPGFAGTLPLRSVRWVVSTLPEQDVNLSLVQALRTHGFEGRIAVVLREADQVRWKTRGVERVFKLYEDAADFAARHIAEALPEDAGITAMRIDPLPRDPAETRPTSTVRQ